MGRLTGKRALITGGTSGIGFETAKQFLNEGAQIIITGVNPESIENTRSVFGNDVLVVQADSANIEAQRLLVNKVEEYFGQLDIAFLNAGISTWMPIESWTEELYDRSFDINVKGPFFLIQSLLPILSKKSSIILNTSINAHVGAINSSVYAATKAALLNMSKTLSSELLTKGIRLNAISPGPVDTPLYDKLGVPEQYREQLNKDIISSIPMGRYGLPDEIAKAVIYLASDESSWTIGSEIVVDGGRLLNA